MAISIGPFSINDEMVGFQDAAMDNMNARMEYLNGGTKFHMKKWYMGRCATRGSFRRP